MVYLAIDTNALLGGPLDIAVRIVTPFVVMGREVSIGASVGTAFAPRDGTTEGDLVLFLYIDFTIKNRDIRGFIALLMDLPSITALKKIVADFIEGIEQQAL